MSDATITTLLAGAFAVLNIAISAFNAFRATRQGAGIKREETSFEQLSKIYQETREELKGYRVEMREKEALIDKQDEEIEAKDERIKQLEAELKRSKGDL